MRVVLLALLIALLPLRGWLGDAMAISMMTTPAAVQSLDDCPHAGGHAMGEPAPHHGGADHAADTAPAEHGNAGSHLLCDVCNGPALETAVPTLTPFAPPNGLRVAPALRFASLAPRQLIEPPIA